MPPLIAVLGSTPHDPRAVCSLVRRLIRPLSFSDVVAMTSEEAIIAALHAASPAAQLLGLDIVAKAAASAAEAAMLAGLAAVVRAFITTWLSSPDVAVGAAATSALTALLATDCAAESRAVLRSDPTGPCLVVPPSGQGLLWRRIFGDRALYASITALCGASGQDASTVECSGSSRDASITESSSSGQVTARAASLAHARLLEALPALALLDFSAITASPHPDVEAALGLGPGRRSLLYFASLHALDRGDELMAYARRDFVHALLGAQALLFADGLGVHETELRLAVLRSWLRCLEAEDPATAQWLAALVERDEDALAQLIKRLA
jgi:hypothetical protein